METELENVDHQSNEPVLLSFRNPEKPTEFKNDMIAINALIDKVTRDNEFLEQLILQNKRIYLPSRTEAT